MCFLELKDPLSVLHALGHLRQVQSRAIHPRVEVPPSLLGVATNCQRDTRTAAMHCLCAWKGRTHGSKHPCVQEEDMRPAQMLTPHRALTLLCVTPGTIPTIPVRFISPALERLIAISSPCSDSLPCLSGLCLPTHSMKEAQLWSITHVQSEGFCKQEHHCSLEGGSSHLSENTEHIEGG